MAEIGTILQTEIVDGQIEARIDTGYGVQITATVAGMSEVHPLKGDRVLFHRTGGTEIVIDAIQSVDADTESGEWRTFSRDATGAVVATIHAKKDGSIAITNKSGKTVDTGNAADFVAMSTPLNNFLTALCAAVAPGGVAVVTPAPGATCPVAAAVYSVMTAIFGSSTADCSSQNLKAD